MALSTGIFNITPGESAKDVDWRRRIALAMLQQGTNAEPIQAPTQGLARMANALIGGYELHKADQDDLRKEAALQKALGNLPGLGEASVAPMAPPRAPMIPSPMPGAPPVTAPAPRVAQAMEGVQPVDVPYEQGGMPVRPPQAAINAATAQLGPPGTPGGAQVTPPIRKAPEIPAQVQTQIKALWANPETRALALQIYQQYATPKDEFQPVTGPNGTPIAQRNITTGEFKEHPNAGYNIHIRQDGAVIATNKTDPKDTQVIVPAGSSQAIAGQAGANKRAEETGQAQGQAEVNYGPSVDTAQRALKTVEQIRNHPGKEWGVGVAGVLPGIPGTQQKGFVTLVDQAKAGTFLQAYQQLRGGGQISNAEGSKAEAAIARLDRAQNQTDFNAALKDYEDVIKIGLERARKQASGLPSESTAPGKRADPLGLR